GTATLLGQVVDITRRVDAEGALFLSQQREALGLLTNSVAHEFNNFLQILIGYVDGLKRRLADRQEPFIQRAVTRSTEAAERAAILTRHLLTHSRRIAPDVRAVDLDAFIGSIGASLRTSLPPRIDLTISTTQDLAPALCNPTQVELALRHILANSAEAITDSGTITVATFAVAPGDRTLQRPSDGAVGIAISDRGHGMSPEMLTRALAPFATSREAGRGVGLAIVHGLMKRQNGTISLDSRQGEGTTVRLIFPAAP
ncbi:ATP-binding protein, partial [Methylobacterium haplocladii]